MSTLSDRIAATAKKEAEAKEKAEKAEQTKTTEES
mgnify:FL=1|tara:strand:- start:589 stop:693 length:105 start_codon:yes stop_codon:yes gene_type:complete